MIDILPQIGLVLLAFVCEFMDSTLGMGYGTTMTPLLLLCGFSPLQIVPAILLSELFTGLSSAFFHHRQGNANLSPRRIPWGRFFTHISTLGFKRSFHDHIPPHLQITAILISGSILGATLSVFTATIVEKKWVELYIGVIVLLMGVVILACLKKSFPFSWKKVASLGFIASFNKGLTGGGYGPLIVSGQILSGVESKNAIGMTSLAEGLTCLVGVTIYLLLTKDQAISWQLAPLIIAGALLATPLSAKSVSRIDPEAFKILIACLTIILGIFTIYKTITKYFL